MSTIEKVERVCLSLRKELGSQLIQQSKDANGPLAYFYPGAEHPVLLFFHETPLGDLLRVNAPVSLWADWITPGLAELLLREQGNWAFGRVERWKESGLAVEHSILAEDTPIDKLASIVLTLADTALMLRRDLERAGALAVPEEAA